MSRKQNPSGTANIQTGRKKKKISIRHTWPYHLLLFPGMMVLLIYTVVPFLGNVIAFQNFKPIMGIAKSKWVGFENFTYMFKLPDTFKIFRNTLVIAIGKLTFNLVMSVFFAILLNEVSNKLFKKTIQTICFLPHFLSWVVLAMIFRDLLDGSGIINSGLMALGIIKEPIVFLGNNSWFQGLMIGTDVWKEFGYGTIVYLAALTGIDPSLYEAAVMDGANRWKQTLHVTLPGILPIIVLMSILAMGNIFNAGFDQIFNMYSPQVYSTGDILDTLVYRIGMLDAQYGVATAIGLFKSVISFGMLGISYALAYRYTDYRVF